MAALSTACAPQVQAVEMQPLPSVCLAKDTCSWLEMCNDCCGSNRAHLQS